MKITYYNGPTIKISCKDHADFSNTALAAQVTPGCKLHIERAHMKENTYPIWADLVEVTGSRKALKEYADYLQTCTEDNVTEKYQELAYRVHTTLQQELDRPV